MQLDGGEPRIGTFSKIFHKTSSSPIPRKSPEFPLGMRTTMVQSIWRGISPVSQMFWTSLTTMRHVSPFPS